MDRLTQPDEDAARAVARAARNPFRSAVRASLKAGLLDAEQTGEALATIDDRNLTVHLYGEAVAEQIWEHIPRPAQLLSRWIDVLRSRVENAQLTGPMPAATEPRRASSS